MLNEFAVDIKAMMKEDAKYGEKQRASKAKVNDHNSRKNNKHRSRMLSPAEYLSQLDEDNDFPQ